MLLANFPWNDVMHFHINVTACWNRTSVTGFNENPSAKFCWDLRAITHSRLCEVSRGFDVWCRPASADFFMIIISAN
jgi:hypothetical protein